jgi:single-strand DNA-binding protein
MPALNRVQLIGYLGRDPESKYTPTGKRVTDFPIGISERWKDNSGELREHTEWIHIEAWGRLAEICHEYLAKGSLVYCQ